LFGLWAAMGIELLARSAVASVSSTLLAEPDKEQKNLLYALNIRSDSAKVKTIGIKQVSAMCSELFDGKFTTDDKKILDALSDRRNEELHTGGLPFESYPPSQWLFPFYRACKSLSECQGKTLEDLLGATESANAESVLAENRHQIEKSVHDEISKHKKTFNALSELEKANVRSNAARIALINSFKKQHMCKCPACESNAGVTGVAIGEEKVSQEYGIIVVRQPISPTGFSCAACNLTLNGYAQLEVVGLAGRYTRSRRYSPEAYYGFDEELEQDPEPMSEYNNE